MIDYHVHSLLSGDAQASLIDMCRAAVELGLTEICFTEHVDFEPTDLCFGAFNHQKYLDEINRARDKFGSRLVIGHGIEVDFQPKYHSQVADFFCGKEFDYIVGSAHYANGIILEDHERYFPGKTAAEAYVPYFQTALAVVESELFDTLAHLDLCKRYGVRYFGEFDWEAYRELIDQILLALIDQDMSLEINTSGLRQSPGEAYPGEGVLERYYYLGGRNITVGSDAHRIEDIGADIKQALISAKRTGFQYINTYHNRRRSAVDISDMLGKQMVEKADACDE